MSDEFEKLEAALRAATPQPDAKNRARNLHMAQKNFERLQGSADAPRLRNERRPLGWLISGGQKMLNAISSRSAIAATTALVAVGLIVISPQGRSLFTPAPTMPPAAKSADTPKPAPAPPSAGLQEMAGSAPAAGSTVKERRMVPPGNGPADGNAPLAELAPQMALDKSDALQQAPITAPASPLPPDMMPAPEADTENFANATSASVHVVATDPVSTFSIDVDTASYAIVRSSLMSGQLPPKEAVRIEEMVNYFPYDYPAPEEAEAPFRPTVTVMQTPWNEDTQLLHIALQGRKAAVADRPPLNLVFLVDTSGSMRTANKLPLLKQSLRLMLPRLRPEDQVAIVAYAGSAGEVLAPTPASESGKILAALDALASGGSTAGQAGLEQAYAIAARMADDGEVSRIILATDGDFNVGLSDTAKLKDFIAQKRDQGRYLSVLGFGRGNLDDATMQALAQNGNGTAAYIDTLNEARKVLVDQFTGALFPIADDVKIQVEFNPAVVAEYRLIGYETRALRREDFNNDRVDAGEIGAGAAVTAIYEVTPVGSPAVLNDDLHFQPPKTQQMANQGEMAFLRLRYKAPGSPRSHLIEHAIANSVSPAGQEARFAVAIAGFGQLLRHSAYLGDWSWGDAIALARGAVGEDAFGYRHEAINLMRLAQSLSAK